ncbi:MAG: TolC family protein [Waddliaceae bacterium]
MHGKVLKFLNITAGIALFLSGCVKTTTHLETQRCQNSAFDKKCLYAGVELERKSMTLDDMVEVALRRNLYLLVKKWECAIQQEAATGAKLDMLPELLASADDTQRSNKPASTSEYMDGSPPFPPSFSSEERTKNWDVTLTWNMLDFGISYFRSRQETNRILMQKLEYERMKQNLILDIVQNYWNAVVNKEAMNKTEQFLVEIETHQMVLERAANTALVSRTRVLEIKDQVLQKTLKFQEHEREYLFAKSELSRLMGLPPSVEFDITYDRSRPLTVDLPDIKQLEETSLFYRPELYSYDIEEKIAVDEVRLAILGYIPGVSLFSSLLYSDNKFLVYNYWNNIGAQVIWDLLSIPAGRSYQRKA